MVGAILQTTAMSMYWANNVCAPGYNHGNLDNKSIVDTCQFTSVSLQNNGRVGNNGKYSWISANGHLC